MPKINPFYNIHRSTPISQFVEQKIPLELIHSNLQAKQARQDELGAAFDKAGLWDQRAITERDKAGRDKIKNEIDATVEKWANADRTTGEAARDLAKLNKMLRDSKELKEIQANVAWYDQFQEDVRKLKLKGESFDVMEHEAQRAIQAYEDRGKITTAGDRIRQIQAEKELDTRAEREKYTDNIKANITETYGIKALDEIKYFVTTGIKTINSERIMAQLMPNLEEYMMTNAGKQDVLKFVDRVLMETGQKPTKEEVSKHMMALMLNTGLERVYQETTQRIKNLPGDGSGKVPKPEYGSAYAFQGAVTDASFNWQKETENYDANKKTIAVLDKKLNVLQDKIRKTGWDSLTDDEKRNYNDYNSQYLGLKESERLYEQTLANATKQVDNQVFKEGHYLSEFPEKMLPGVTLKEYKEAMKLAIKQGKPFMPNPANPNAPSFLGDNPKIAKAFDSPKALDMDHRSELFNAYLAVTKEYGKAWDDLKAEGKVVQPVNMLFGDSGTKIAKATKALNDAFQTGAIDWVTTTESQNSADPDLMEEMQHGVEGARWTGEISNGKPVILMTYKSPDKKTTLAKQVTLGNNAASRQVTMTLAKELIDDGNKSGNKIIADLGHSINGYHLPPTKVADQTKQAKGSLGQQLYGGKRYMQKGGHFDVEAVDKKFKIRRADTDSEKWQVFQYVNGNEVNVVEVVSGYEADKSGSARVSKAKYVDNFKDIAAYIHKLVYYSDAIEAEKKKKQ